MQRLKAWKVPFACVLAVAALACVVVASLGKYERFRFERSVAAANQGEPSAAAKDAAEVSLRDALGRKWVQAQYRGNGHSEIRAVFANASTMPLRVRLDSGTIFETTDRRHQMVVTRGESVALAPGEKRFARLTTAATHTSNPLKDLPYELCPEDLKSLGDLFVQADKTPEVSRDAIQTAILLLTENAPLATFAKFSLLADDAAAKKPATDVYQVNTGEMLSAFELLKEAGYSRLNLTAPHDPQLKIEAMIDPLSHAAALHYYNIGADKEWPYWRDELQKGDVSTRHYALYGIGRYYPDVALQMLPTWARTKHLSPLYRNSAIQALAETHRAEAISVLQQLAVEFGAKTELGESARKSIAYLENQRTVLPGAPGGVEFRISQASVR